MPKRRRRSRVPVPVWERERGAIGSRVLGRRPQFYATAGVVLMVVVAIGLIVFGFGSDWIEDRNRPGSTAIQVEDTKYSVRYYTERLRRYIQQLGGAGTQFGQNPQFALALVSDELIREAILLRFAEEQGQSATDDEIKTEIATMLTLSGPDDPTFDARFQEELTRTNIPEAQYRDMAKAAVLNRKVQAKFTAEVPAAAESIHYRQIVVGEDQAAADAIKRQIEGGADFAQIAAEKSQDTTAKENGGDAGWAPRGSLETTLEDSLFALEPGQVITFPTQSNVYVYQLLEKQADRPIDEAQKPTLAQTAYQDWLDEKRASVKIVDEMQIQDGDLKKIEYAISRVQQAT